MDRYSTVGEKHHKTLRDAMSKILEDNPDIEFRKALDFQLAQARQAFGRLYRQELPIHRQKEFAYGYLQPLIEFLEMMDEL